MEPEIICERSLTARGDQRSCVARVVEPGPWPTPPVDATFRPGEVLTCDRHNRRIVLTVERVPSQAELLRQSLAQRQVLIETLLRIARGG